MDLGVGASACSCARGFFARQYLCRTAVAWVCQVLYDFMARGDKFIDEHIRISNVAGGSGGQCVGGFVVGPKGGGGGGARVRVRVRVRV